MDEEGLAGLTEGRVMRDRVDVNNARWGERLVRPGGRVRWLGRWFVPEDGALSEAEFLRLPMDQRVRAGGLKYDGRIDGKRALFYTYGNLHEASKTHIYLHSVGDEWPGLSCIGGVFCWETFCLDEREDD